jgi:hypothetical protein
MVARSKLVFACYSLGVIVFFSCVGFYVTANEQGDVPNLLEWIGMPGVLLAVFCLVGVHSDHFVLASILANIAVYLLVPWLLWRLFVFCKELTTPRQPK